MRLRASLKPCYFLLLSLDEVADDDTRLGCCDVGKSCCRMIRRFDSHHIALAGDLDVFVLAGH